MPPSSSQPQCRTVGTPSLHQLSLCSPLCRSCQPIIRLRPHRRQFRFRMASSMTAALAVDAAPACAAAVHALTAHSPAYEVAGLYSLINQIDGLVQQQLTSLTPASFAVVLAAGLLTSLSPCTLSVLPLTIGYIGGYSADTSGSSLGVRAAAFSAGLATTLAGLGVLSTAVGSAYGQIGDGLPIAVGALACLMGLNLLEVLPLRLPSLDLDVRNLQALQGLPPSTRAALQAYLAGLTFALAASPCSTPVLATLLAWVSTTQDPVAGAALLLAYSLGYVAPLLGAALFTGALAQLLAVRRWSAWVTPVSGVLLLGGGTYALLSRLVPA